MRIRVDIQSPEKNEFELSVNFPFYGKIFFFDDGIPQAFCRRVSCLYAGYPL